MQHGLRAGQSLAGYRLLRLIGEGGSGTVYLAEQPATRQIVAMKVVPLPPGQARAAAGTQFLEAASAACRLHHAGIVKSHDAGLEGALGWLTMEPVPGTDLARYTRQPRLLPDRLVVNVCARLADALAHAHGLGVVHRDLKPGNVLVNWATNAVKLADFGLARSTGAASTGTGIVMGSPAYMAPEQLAGAVPSPASDLYALGALLFELLTGRLPHEGQSMGDLLRQVAQEPPPDLLALRPGLPPGLGRLVATLLAKSPTHRPAGGGATAQQLRALSQAMGPASSPSTSPSTSPTTSPTNSSPGAKSR